MHIACDVLLSNGYSTVFKDPVLNISSSIFTLACIVTKHVLDIFTKKVYFNPKIIIQIRTGILKPKMRPNNL